MAYAHSASPDDMRSGMADVVRAYDIHPYELRHYGATYVLSQAWMSLGVTASPETDIDVEPAVKVSVSMHSRGSVPSSICVATLFPVCAAKSRSLTWFCKRVRVLVLPDVLLV